MIQNNKHPPDVWGGVLIVLWVDIIGWFLI